AAASPARPPPATRILLGGRPGASCFGACARRTARDPAEISTALRRSRRVGYPTFTIEQKDSPRRHSRGGPAEISVLAPTASGKYTGISIWPGYGLRPTLVCFMTRRFYVLCTYSPVLLAPFSRSGFDPNHPTLTLAQRTYYVWVSGSAGRGIPQTRPRLVSRQKHRFERPQDDVDIQEYRNVFNVIEIVL